MTSDASAPPLSAAIHRFDDWELFVHEHRLVVRGQSIKIGRPAFSLLCALADRAGRVATKDELIDAAWPGRVVEENNLSVQVTTLRRVLGAAAIVNVSGVGYRLAATPCASAEELPFPRPRPAQATGPSPLIGRDADVAAVEALLVESPLVSIIGTGGVGKTSLARTVAHARRNHWRDGTHWIDLAPLAPGAPLLPLLSRTFGISSPAGDALSDDLLLSMSSLQALVVLDNCEHLLEEVADLVGPILLRATGIRWLATTQVRLQIDGETVYRLAPLQLPRQGADPARATDSGALALFLERARGTDQRFGLEGRQLELATEICRQLDGLPLAIEMAAARVTALGLQGVRDQIEHRLRLRAATRDGPERQHTLQKTYEWSYGLLTPSEQRLFRSLEPFVGGFTAQMARQLYGALDDSTGAHDPWLVLDTLSALVDRSLVQRVASTTPGEADRLHLLESARDYARLCLEANGEVANVRRCHAEVVAGAFANVARDLDQWCDRDWTRCYLPEHRNVCAALDWAGSAGDPVTLAQLVVALALLERLGVPQGDLLRFAVPLDVLEGAPPSLRALAFCEYGWAHFQLADPARVTHLLERALADFEALGDIGGAHATLTRLLRISLGTIGAHDAAAAALWQRLCRLETRLVPLRSQLICSLMVAVHFDGDRSVEQLQHLHHVAQSAGYDWLASACRLNITDVLLIQGQFADAAEIGQRELQTADPIPSIRALICHNVALALVRLGRFAQALEFARAMLRAGPGSAYMVMDLFAFTALQLGHHADAALMAGRSACIKRERALRSVDAEAALIAETMAGLHAALGDAPLARMMSMGASMADADVLRLACAD